MGSNRKRVEQSQRNEHTKKTSKFGSIVILRNFCYVHRTDGKVAANTYSQKKSANKRQFVANKECGKMEKYLAKYQSSIILAKAKMQKPTIEGKPKSIIVNFLP